LQENVMYWHYGDGDGDGEYDDSTAERI
jgi:hypothetical protein